MAIQNSENIANRKYSQIGSFTPGAAATELSLVIPSGTIGIRGRIEGGGAGGGSGARYGTTPIVGGMGGTHGGVVEFDFLLTQINCLPGDTLYVYVANAVAGGVARSTNSNGQAGTAGQATEIRKTNSAGAIIARAAGGNAGGAVGQIVVGATAGVPCSWGTGVGGVATLLQGATNGLASRNASSCGGNGGSQNGSDSNGANAGAPANELRTVAGATGGTWASGSPNGNSGVSISVLSDASGFTSGGGGGSSPSSITGLAGNGGNGGVNAGGGGGGSLFEPDGGSSGAGGNGGPGRIFIEFYIGSVMSVDANAWSFIQATGLTDSAHIQAIYNLVAGLKANGTWSKYLAIYPLVGGTADTHKFNLKDPQDLNSSYRITWSGSVTHDSLGISSASSGYGNTNLNPTTAGMSASSVSLVTYQEVGTVDNSISVGVNTTSPSVEWALAVNTNGFYPAITSDGTYPLDGNPNPGLFVATRNNGTTILGYNNSSSPSVNDPQGSTVVPNSTFYLLASNVDSSVGSPTPTSVRFVAIGSGLTSTEVGNDYTVIQAYQTALGRQL